MGGSISTPIRWIPAYGKLAAKARTIKHGLKTLAFLSASGRLRPDGPELFPLPGLVGPKLLGANRRLGHP